MDRTTDGGSAEEFYDDLSAHYDLMTDFPGRYAREEPAMRDLAARLGVRTAVDAGTGTGFHALLLARLGVEVTAVDVSPRMLERVQGHATTAGLTIRTLQAQLSELSPRLLPPVDAVFCLGNTLAHLPGAPHLTAALRAFRSILRPDGAAVLHLLNYASLLQTRERIQNVREAGNIVFVRFYDYRPDGLLFNILRLERQEEGVRHSLSSVPLTPFTRDDLHGALTEAGFTDVTFHADLKGSAFQPTGSRDLFAVARSHA
jgi:SAM-dependent methyltransferase